MIPRWVKSEFWTGEGDPNGNADIFNRANRDLWETFCQQHAKNGNHYTFPFANVEQGTYSGNSADNRNITLTDSTINIKFIVIMSEYEFGAVYRSENMSGDVTKPVLLLGQGGTPASSQAFTANVIQSVGTGTFQVGTNIAVNQSGQTYYYLAIGSI